MRFTKLVTIFFKKRLSAAGVSYIVSNNSIFRRILWIFLLLGTLSLMSFLSYNVILEYLAYPKVVQTWEEAYPYVIFPAVTLCPLQRLKKNYFSESSLKGAIRLKKIVDNVISKKHSISIREQCNRNPMCHFNWFRETCPCVESPCNSEFCLEHTNGRCLCLPIVCKTRDSFLANVCNITSLDSRQDLESGNEKCVCDKSLKYPMARKNVWNSTKANQVVDAITDSYAREMARLILNSRTHDLTDLEQEMLPSTDDYTNYGISSEQFITGCTFEGRTCSYKNFTMFYNLLYGRCFMFNYGDNPLTIDKSGSTSGLQLKIYMPRSFVPFYLDQGVRLTLHDPQKFPMINENGVDISRFMGTSVQVSLMYKRRLAAPWGICSNYDAEAADSHGGTHLDQEACQKNCRIMEILKSCLCLKVNFLVGVKKVDISENVTPLCSNKSKKDKVCVSKVLAAIESNNITCECPPLCWEMVYSSTVTQAVMNKDFLKLLNRIKTLKLHNNEITTVNETGGDLIVKVYFKSLDVTYTREVASYSWETLVANIGGNGGFFLGLTIVTFLQILEFFWDVLWTFFCKSKKKRNRKKTRRRKNDTISILLREHSTL